MTAPNIRAADGLCIRTTDGDVTGLVRLEMAARLAVGLAHDLGVLEVVK